jgi:hypothetical protein
MLTGDRLLIFTHCGITIRSDVEEMRLLCQEAECSTECNIGCAEDTITKMYSRVV